MASSSVKFYSTDKVDDINRFVREESNKEKIYEELRWALTWALVGNTTNEGIRDFYLYYCKCQEDYQNDQNNLNTDQNKEFTEDKSSCEKNEHIFVIDDKNHPFSMKIPLKEWYKNNFFKYIDRIHDSRAKNEDEEFDSQMWGEINELLNLLNRKYGIDPNDPPKSFGKHANNGLTEIFLNYLRDDNDGLVHNILDDFLNHIKPSPIPDNIIRF